MDAIVAALVGVIGMLVSGGFVWLRSEIVPRLDRMDERLDSISDLLRSQGERIARVEGREEAAAAG